MWWYIQLTTIAKKTHSQEDNRQSSTTYSWREGIYLPFNSIMSCPVLILVLSCLLTKRDSEVPNVDPDILNRYNFGPFFNQLCNVCTMIGMFKYLVFNITDEIIFFYFIGMWCAVYFKSYYWSTRRKWKKINKPSIMLWWKFV